MISRIGSIGRKLLFLTLGCVFVPLSIIGVIAVSNETATIRKHTLIALEIIADYAEQEINDLLKYLKGRTEDFSSDGFIRDSLEKLNHNESDSSMIVAALNKHLSKNKLPIIPNAVETFVLNTEGRVAASSDTSQIGKDHPSSAWFVKGSTGLFVSDVFRSSRDQKASWIVSAPLTGKVSGKFIGVICNRIDPSMLNNIISKHYTPRMVTNRIFELTGQTAETYIVNREGLMLTESRFIENAILNHVVDTKPVRVANESAGELVGEYTDYRGVPIIGASMLIRETGWVVISEIDKVEAMLPVRQFIFKIIVISILIILAVYALMYFVVMKFVQPIVSIANTCDYIAKGNWDERVEVKSEKGEIAQLANAFNSMVGSLLESFSSLLESEKRFRSIVNDMPIMICAFDEGLNFVVWNSECERVTGIDHDNIIGNTNALELLYPGVTNKEYVQTKWIDSGDDYRDWEMQMSCKDGGVKTILWSNISNQYPITGWKKWVVGIDITKRKQMKMELVEKTIYLDNILSSSTDIAIVATGINYRIKYYNPMAEQLFGYRADQVIARSVMDIHSDLNVDRARFEKGIEIVREKGEHSFVIEQVKDKKTVFIQVRISGILDIYTQLVGFVFMGKDITKRIESERALDKYVEELAQSNTELEQFAYVASHDLQEPLRMIGSYLQLLERRYGDKLDKDATEFIDFAVDGANRMQALINDLLAYSRVGTKGKEFEPTDCNVMLSRTIKNLQTAIMESRASINIDLLPTVFADKSQLGQLFQNLIGNAIKFSGKRASEITISALLKGKKWTFSVRDNGIGIDPKQFDRIFLMFQRLHSRTEYRGTGIGLAMCKKIVERHGGEIWVESEPGKGSTFFFTIPSEKSEKYDL